MEFVGIGVIVCLAALLFFALVREGGASYAMKVVGSLSVAGAFVTLVFADVVSGVGFVEGLLYLPVVAGLLSIPVIFGLFGVMAIVEILMSMFHSVMGRINNRRQQLDRVSRYLEH